MRIPIGILLALAILARAQNAPTQGTARPSRVPVFRESAMARKLACLFYRLLKHGQQYVDKGTEYYEQRHRERQIRLLFKRAKQLGTQVVTPVPTNA